MNAPTIPDHVSPVVGYRVWYRDATGRLRSGTGEEWLPGRALAAKCLMGMVGFGGFRFPGIAANCPIQDHESPADGCSCGVYAAKNYAQLQNMIGVAGHEVRGEVYLWGRVVEHGAGYRAQFAYPKSFVLQPPAWDLLSLEPSHLEPLMVYGADISISLAPNILLWTKGSGYTPACSDWLAGRGKPCGKWCERWHQRTLQMGDCVTVLGQGVGLVERDDSAPSDTVCVRLTNDYVFIVPQQGIVWNCQTWRWEAERWDVDLSGYRDKGCPLLVRRKFRSSNGKGSNKTPLLPDPVIPRTSTPPKSREELSTVRLGLHRSSSPGSCGVCGSFDVYFDWGLDIHVCGGCGAHEAVGGWQKP
jgi:hypothetical protein